jgi:uncharacterized membrane protein YraQ (UPF0718 family)
MSSDQLAILESFHNATELDPRGKICHMKRAVEFLGAVVLGLAAVVLFFFLQSIRTGSLTVPEQLSIFSTIFLGIFIEAAPFLLLGTLASGFVEVFFNREQLNRFIPSNPILGALSGGLMGLFFPVCECGVVPLTRRLFKKGLPPAVGIAFLLASPVLNPIVIASTYAAYGWGPMLWLRLGLSLVIAVSVGLVFSVQKYPFWLLKPASLPVISGASQDTAHDLSVPTKTPLFRRVRSALLVASDEFFEMGRYLIIGAMLAALMQTFIPQTALLELGQGPFTSILVMIALAVILSICSTVDAFVSLAFVGTFMNGSILAFLVFGPMVDIKSTLMFLQVFRKKTVVYLILLPLLMTILAAVYLNFYTAF